MISNSVEGFDLTRTHHEVIEEGPVSTVSRTKLLSNNGRDSRWVAVKSAPTRSEFSKEPHDIIKELRILSGTSHTNIIDILGQDVRKKKSLQFWMPYVPHALSDLLASPSFSPHPFEDTNKAFKEAHFNILAKSILFQIISAVAYLHGLRIAHRDIKPNNVLLTHNACVKLIDFGISWKEDEDAFAKKGDLWPEYADRMYFEVSTGQVGPYRAPEILFGTRSYDAFAIDLWSLGATFAGFFTTLRMNADEDEDEDGSFVSEDNRDKPFVIPETIRPGAPQKWFRDSLFNAERGEIGLAWSIFKILGSPTEENWPTFGDLPHASGVTFNTVPSVNLASLLPNLPSSDKQNTAETLSRPDGPMAPSPLDLLQRLLVHTPSRRLHAANALSHPWLIADPPVLLPSEYRLANTDSDILQVYPATVWNGNDLGEWFRKTLSADLSL